MHRGQTACVCVLVWSRRLANEDGVVNFSDAFTTAPASPWSLGCTASVQRVLAPLHGSHVVQTVMDLGQDDGNMKTVSRRAAMLLTAVADEDDAATNPSIRQGIQDWHGAKAEDLTCCSESHPGLCRQDLQFTVKQNIAKVAYFLQACWPVCIVAIPRYVCILACPLVLL